MKTVMMKSLMVALVFSLAACGDEHDHDDDASPVEEACEHMQQGPSEDVTAVADTTAAPSIAYEHTRVDIALLGDADPYTGYVTYESSEVGEVMFFLSSDATIAVMDSQETPLTAEATTMVEACDEVAVAYTYDLEVGTYYVYFESTNAAISVVAEEGMHDHSEE